MTRPLDGQRALVTGPASAATALALVRAGAGVLATGRDAAARSALAVTTRPGACANRIELRPTRQP
jgi:hypothetical protein